MVHFTWINYKNLSVSNFITLNLILLYYLVKIPKNKFQKANNNQLKSRSLSS